MKPVECFHIGPQKAATTWVYQCLAEHPEIACPPEDTIHYFDIFYTKGRNWYSRFFKNAKRGQKLFDPTYTYIRSPWVPERIYKENPKAKIVICIRDPIERAFSHYWHEKKKKNISFEFGDVLTNYDLFSSWIEPGFYAKHIERYLDYFPREQILCLRFQMLKEDNEGFLHRLLSFFEVNPSHKPSVVKEKVNEAGERRTVANQVWKRIRSKLHRLGQDFLVDKIQANPLFGRWIADRYEYEAGVQADIRRELEEICEPEVRRLEALLDLDLSYWRHSTR